MLNHITWTQFIIAAGASLAVYYLFITFRYLPEIKEYFLGGRSQDFFNEDDIQGPAGNYEMPEEEQVPDAEDLMTDELFDEAQELLDQVKKVIDQAETENLDQEAIIGKLKVEVQRYPQLNHPAFRPGINYTIIEESEKLGALMLSEEAIEKVWLS